MYGRARVRYRVRALAVAVACTAVLVPAAKSVAQVGTTTTSTSAPTSTSTSTTTSTTIPEQRDPSWAASVTLGCDAQDSTRRVVLSFTTTVDPRPTALYLATPSGGGFLLTQLEVGDSIAAESSLVWSIIGVELGPWPVDSVSDTCAPVAQELPFSGSTNADLWAVVGGSLLVTGATLVITSPARARRKRYRH